MGNKFEGYLLVTDMDGTMLNSSGKLSTENLEAIKYFIENGGIFTVATGRMLASADRFLKKLPIEIPVILYNGSKVYDYKTKSTIYERYLEEERKDVIKRIKDDYPSVGIEIYLEENIYIYQHCIYTERLSKKGYSVFESIEEEEWNRRWTKVLMIGNRIDIDKLESEFYYKYDKGTVIRSGERFLEISANGVTKGQALESLSNKLKIDRSNIVAIGDNMNDLEMLNYAHYGFCVSSGNGDLVDKINLKAPSNDENAVKYVVNWIEDKVSSKKNLEKNVKCTV